MTNNEIIENAVKATFTPAELAALVEACFTPDQIAARRDCVVSMPEGTEEAAGDWILEEMAAETFHTFQEWKRLGYSVKKGEHAAITAFLWKYKERRSKATDEEPATEGGAAEDLAKAGPYFCRVKSYLFNRLQVEKIQK